ncbi:hypothetical protein QNA24_25235 [Rhodococcus qingshengii]|uniref:hypothetical protein n=1 Tax=Rhodococcus qingshengii TaxID=334542 RepID=UPI0024BA674F|nr:hypothetical protein [Rhodococcus qingshengii]MDJ0489687.1 hypothetical protein [Rhodococcus qingshengii]
MPAGSRTQRPKFSTLSPFEADMPKTIIAIIVAMWLGLAAIGAWNTVAFAIAALAAVASGCYLLANAVTGPRHR